MKLIVLGNSEFALGMRFAGLGESHIITKREDGLNVLQNIPKDSFIIANKSVNEMMPELSDFNNLVILPDNPSDLEMLDDLKGIIKRAVGIELEVV